MRGAISRRGCVPLLSAGLLVAACAGAAYAGGEGNVLLARAEVDGSESATSAAAPQGSGVVFCEAGCLGDRPEIVYIEPSIGADDGTGSILSSASASHLIECVAGCYDTQKIYDAVPHDMAAQESGAGRTSTLEEKAPIKREPFSPLR